MNEFEITSGFPPKIRRSTDVGDAPFVVTPHGSSQIRTLFLALLVCDLFETRDIIDLKIQASTTSMNSSSLCYR